MLLQVLLVQNIQLILRMNLDGFHLVKCMRQHIMAFMMLNVNHGLCLSYLPDTFDVNTSQLSYDLRSFRMNVKVPKARTNYFRNIFASAGVKLWNSLPSSLKKDNFWLRPGRM